MANTPEPDPLLIKLVSDEMGIWNQPIFIALLAFVGVGIGALVTVLTNRHVSRSEDQRQWDESILDLFLGIKDETTLFTERHNDGDQRHFSDLSERQSAALLEVRKSVDRLHVIAVPTRKSSASLLESMENINGSAMSAKYNEEAVEKLHRHMSDFEAAVRRTLRLK